MAISAGEVTAVLTARDNMSAAITQVTQRIAELKAQMIELGTSSGSTFEALNAELASNQVLLGDLQANLRDINQGLATTGEVATSTGGQLEQMDRIATRLVERLLVFYALKETFTFTVGLFQDAANLSLLNQQFDLSIEKLQVLKFGANELDVPFTKVTGAVEAFDKKMAEMTPAVGNELINLGLNFGKLGNMSADARLDAVMTSIAGLGSAAARSKAEFILFGTDAIDPIIVRITQLEQQAKANNVIMGDDTVGVMTQTINMYKGAGQEFSNYASTVIAKAQDIFAELGKPLMGQGMGNGNPLTGGGVSIATLLMFGLTGGDFTSFLPNMPKMGDISLPSESKGKPGDNLTGQPYLDSLWKQSMAMKGLTDVEKDQIDQLRQLDLLDNAHITRLNISTDVAKQYVAQLKEQEKTELEMEKREKLLLTDLANINSASVDYRTTLHGMNQDFVMYIGGLAAAGVGHQTLEREFNLTAAQVNAMEKAYRADATAMVEVTKLQGELNALTVGGKTAYDQQVDAIDRWAEDLMAKEQKAGTDTAQFYDTLTQLWVAKLSLIGVNTKAIIDENTNDTRAGLQQIADARAKDLQIALDHIGVWSDSYITKTRAAYEAAQKAADDWGGDNAAWIDALVKKNKQLQDAIDATAAKQQAAASFFLTPQQLGFVNPFIPGSTGYLPPGRASGGPVESGRPYLINENTPQSEIFIPNVSGYISPNVGGGAGGGIGGVSINPTIIIQSLTPGDPKTIEYIRQAADNAVVNSLRNLVKMGRA